MDLSQAIWLSKNKPEWIGKVEVIGISDEYLPDEERLIELVEYWHNIEYKTERRK